MIDYYTEEIKKLKEKIITNPNKSDYYNGQIEVYEKQIRSLKEDDSPLMNPIKCPYCDWSFRLSLCSRLFNNSLFKVMGSDNCPSCHQRILYRNGAFIKIDK